MLVLSLFVAVPLVLVLLAGLAAARGGHPTDEELTTRFLSHESGFAALINRLDSDRGRLSPGTESADLADVVQAGAGRVDYEVLLARIGATGFHYFPRSGNLIVPVSKPGDPFAVTRKSYLYLSREEQQPLLHHQSYASRGPAVHWATGDHRIKGRWFIHHDETVVGAFAPY
ncbi:MAG: hypothetical protein JWO52_85 [Gammaproteobacteria bacterium]|nr:hypothetical protein [Gammaproteobacteria bacterium]